jgi:hypothetical protein
MTEPAVTALLADGPYDGQVRKVPAQCDVIYVGHIKAAFTDGDITPPENLIGRGVLGYRLEHTRDDGVRVYRYVQPAAAPVTVTRCPLCLGTDVRNDGAGWYCLACPWDDA